MKKEHQKNLRYCDKIRQAEYFIEADGLQKKIRNKISPADSYDAQVKMRQIECFWKKDQDYDRVHHTYLEPKTTKPRVYLQSANHSHDMLTHYYELLTTFITKLKIQHEDETNYRIDLQPYPYRFDQDVPFDSPSEKTALLSLEHLLKVFSYATGQMSCHFQQQRLKSADLMVEQHDSVMKIHLDFFQTVCEQLLNVEQSQGFLKKRQQAVKFISFMTSLILESRQKSMSSWVVAVQPFLGELTYMLHPMCFAIYGLFSHEILIRNAKKLRGKCYQQEHYKPLKLDHENINFPHNQFLHIKDNPKVQQYRHSKIIFLNLDGYQSQFTLQLLRNFHKHVMYVSFPKFCSTNGDQNYNMRFHKKIMFNYTKPQSEFFDWQQGPESVVLQQESCANNPQNYYKTIESLYGQISEKDPVPDYNENMYIFPIRMDNLKSDKQPQKNKDIEQYQSTFIRFLMRDHLYSDMLAFRAKTIIVSYSGRISIENAHFVEMMQQLTKVCPNIILFPNFTTALIREQMNGYLDNYQTMAAYDKVYNDIGRLIIAPERPGELQLRVMNYYESQMESNPCEVDFMDKMSIFLKVTSGNYNLTRPFEQQALENKFKNCQIFDYVIHLFDALKHEYQHCKKRLQRDSLEAAKGVMNHAIQRYAKELQGSVPIYYRELFIELDKLITHRKLPLEQPSNLYSEEKLLLLQLIDKLQGQSSDSSTVVERWKKFRTEQCFSIANQKYQEFTYLQVLRQPSKVQYLNVKADPSQNLNSLYKVSFCLREHNTEILKIYKETSLHYLPNQNFKQHKSQFHILMTNLLSLDEKSYENYVCRAKFGNKEQRCFVTPIAFRWKEGQIRQRDKFQLWTQWNYAETQHYILLYWPQQFNYISYYLHSMLKQNYEAPLKDYIFVCQKGVDYTSRSQRAYFHLLNLPEAQVFPRWGCSVLFIGDQLYIFGGFHDRQKSYLELQNEISTLDLTDFKPSTYQPRKVFNLRKELYCGQVFMGHIREGRTPYSFVRPRMNFQFYDYEDLNLDGYQPPEPMKQEAIKKVIMIGGYGQDFKTPHSLFINYYYLLRFDLANRRLLSIAKKLVYGKVLPVNVKTMIKNRGVFHRNNILHHEDNKLTLKERITNNSHYFYHRIVYALEKGELVAKVKNFFALEEIQLSKRDLIGFGNMMGENKIRTESEPVLVKKVQGSNHHLWVQIKDQSYLYSIYLELDAEERDSVPLSNQSIISLDTKRFTVYALISHPIYTNSKTVLTCKTLAEPDPSLITHNQHLALVLNQLYVFESKVNLHSLIACNVNEVVVVQGMAFQGNCTQEMLIKAKAKSQNDLKKEGFMPPTIPSQNIRSITTSFSKSNNLITGINLILFNDRPEQITLIIQSLDLQRFHQGWKDLSTATGLTLSCKGLTIRPVAFELRQESISQEIIVVIFDYSANKYKKKIFAAPLARMTEGRRQIQVEEVDSKGEKNLNYKPKLACTVKTVQKYEDFCYFE